MDKLSPNYLNIYLVFINFTRKKLASDRSSLDAHVRTPMWSNHSLPHVVQSQFAACNFFVLNLFFLFFFNILYLCRDFFFFFRNHLCRNSLIAKELGNTLETINYYLYSLQVSSTRYIQRLISKPYFTDV